MMRRKAHLLLTGLGLAWLGTAIHAPAAEMATLYTNDFSKAEVGRVPEEFLVLDGRFAVMEDAGNKLLELPGAPLETFGVMFGSNEKAGVAVRARIRGTSKGRRYPVFGVGLSGVAGYKLRVAPAKKALVLLKGDEVKANVPYAWESGTWTLLHLQVRPLKDGGWRVEGRAWKEGTKEPADWMITWNEPSEPRAGRPSIWGLPYAGTPIQFDDLAFVRLPAEK